MADHSDIADVERTGVRGGGVPVGQDVRVQREVCGGFLARDTQVERRSVQRRVGLRAARRAAGPLAADAQGRRVRRPAPRPGRAQGRLGLHAAHQWTHSRLAQQTLQLLL